MEDKDEKEFAKILAGLSEVFEPGADISPIRAEIYFHTLKSYNIQQIKDAAYVIFRTRKYNTMPKPAEFIEAIIGDKDDQALEAWLEVRKVLTGPPGERLNDPVSIEAIKHMGGWGVLSQSSERDLIYRSREFEKIYKLLIKKNLPEQEKIKKLSEKTQKLITGIGEWPE